ncbi:hypothetical protein IG193_02140 [Infirmifilum lucidum]|uniref:Uncharacterized protein n=1 Tax=Infirmifilum lucidum TaxID=2776706 RepID=A0A7L9FKF0_9CREN|nr:hypothetical protein [Infirmifilum lucidum]QOJ79285.1 hypothetical protein IG193_02140 [Infirmifilum lucidum]
MRVRPCSKRLQLLAAVLMNALGLLAGLYGVLAFKDNPSLDTIVRLDYLLWADFALTLAAVAINVKVFSASHSVASTYVLNLVYAVLLLYARLASTLQSMLDYDLMNPPVGTVYTPRALPLALLVVVLSALNLVPSLVHLLLSRPVALADAYTLHQVLERAKPTLARRLDIGTPRRAIPLAFLTAFIVRLYPELKYWPWHVGWDTVEYVAHLSDFLEKPNPFAPHYWMGGMRHIPPLLDIVLALPARLAGAWLAFKLYPPIAYGALAAVTCVFAARLSKDWRKGYVASLLSALYILNLRISWDYQRQLLGSILLLATLAALDTAALGPLSKATLLVLTALSHEVTAFAAVAVSAYWLWEALKRREKPAPPLVALTASTLLELWYWGAPVTPNPYTQVVPPGLVPYDYYSEAPQTLAYLVAGLAPLLLPASLSRHKPRYTAVAALALLLAGTSPLIAPYTAAATWYRFLIQVSPILAPVAFLALLETRADGRLVAAALAAAVALPSAYYIAGSPMTSKYASSIREFPYAMVPGNAPHVLAEMNKTAWLVAAGNHTAIAAEPSIARFIHLYMRNPSPQQLAWLWSSSATLPCNITVTPTLIVTQGELQRGPCNATIVPVDTNATFKVYLVKP